jgi:hypothetical protein
MSAVKPVMVDYTGTWVVRAVCCPRGLGLADVSSDVLASTPLLTPHGRLLVLVRSSLIIAGVHPRQYEHNIRGSGHHAGCVHWVHSDQPGPSGCQ